MRGWVLCLMSALLFIIGTTSYAKENILKAAKSSKGEVAFYYENLVTGAQMMSNENQVFPAASTIKLPLVVYVYRLAAEGKLSLDEKLTYTKGFYYEGTGVIRYEKVGTQYTIRDLVKKSLVHSDNIAYSMLKSRVGQKDFSQYLKSLGGKVVSSHGIKSMNCTDYSLYVKDFYNFTLQYPQLGAELLDFAKHTDFNDHMPAGVPDLEVAHKIGWLPKEKLYHDGGIVYDKEPYMLIIFSKGLSDKEQRSYFKTLTENIQTYHATKRMIPLREWVKEQNGQISWDPTTQKVSATYGSTSIVIDEINKKLFINGQMQPFGCQEYNGVMYMEPELIRNGE